MQVFHSRVSATCRFSIHAWARHSVFHSRASATCRYSIHAWERHACIPFTCERDMQVFHSRVSATCRYSIHVWARHAGIPFTRERDMQVFHSRVSATFRYSIHAWARHADNRVKLKTCGEIFHGHPFPFILLVCVKSKYFYRLKFDKKTSPVKWSLFLTLFGFAYLHGRKHKRRHRWYWLMRKYPIFKKRSPLRRTIAKLNSWKSGEKSLNVKRLVIKCRAFSDRFNDSLSPLA